MRLSIIFGLLLVATSGVSANGGSSGHQAVVKARLAALKPLYQKALAQQQQFVQGRMPATSHELALEFGIQPVLFGCKVRLGIARVTTRDGRKQLRLFCGGTFLKDINIGGAYLGISKAVSHETNDVVSVGAAKDSRAIVDGSERVPGESFVNAVGFAAGVASFDRASGARTFAGERTVLGIGLGSIGSLNPKARSKNISVALTGRRPGKQRTVVDQLVWRYGLLASLLDGEVAKTLSAKRWDRRAARLVKALDQAALAWQPNR